jgi:hypothetical protein
MPNYSQGSRGLAGGASGKRISMKSSVRMSAAGAKLAHTVHFGLCTIIAETVGDDIARGQRPEVDPVVRLHHTKGLLEPQAERTSHTSGDMATQGTKAARHGAPGLHVAVLHTLTRLEGRIPQCL